MLYGLKGHPLELSVHLAMVYGLRCGEICGLCWEDINWDDSLLYVRRNAVLTYDTDGSSRVIQTETMKTQASRRTFPLHPQTRALMLGVRAEQAGEGKGAIFIAKNGRPMRADGLSKRFCHFLQQNGLPKIQFHDLRHPYVKHTTKKYNSEKQKTQATKMNLIAWVFRFCTFNYSKRSWTL